MNTINLTVGGKPVPANNPAARFFNNLVLAGLSPDTIIRAARSARTRREPKVFDATKAVKKINQDLATQGYPALEGEPFVVERGTYIVCQVKMRLKRVRKGQPIYAYGYGFSKYNPNDDKLGMEYDPNVGRRLALSRAVTDCVASYKQETNG